MEFYLFKIGLLFILLPDTVARLPCACLSVVDFKTTRLFYVPHDVRNVQRLKGGSSKDSGFVDEKWMEDVSRNVSKLGKAAANNQQNIDLALREAARIGHDALIKHLVKQGASVNKCAKSPALSSPPNNSKGQNSAEAAWQTPVAHAPLHTAAGMGHASAVQTLLDCGADANLRDGDGGSALHWAALRGHSNAIAVLIGGGADVNARDGDGFTPLHCAASQSHDPRLAIGLLAAADTPEEARAMANRRDRNGDSPLHYAALYGLCDAIRALLRAGACPTAANGDGITPSTVKIALRSS